MQYTRTFSIFSSVIGGGVYVKLSKLLDNHTLLVVSTSKVSLGVSQGKNIVSKIMNLITLLNIFYKIDDLRVASISGNTDLPKMSN